VTNGLGRNSVELNQGNVRSASVAQSDERTRLVLNLRQAANYRVQVQGKSLIVLLESAAPAAAAGGTATHFAPAQNEQPMAVRDVDFRRGNEGAGRVIVDLPSTQVGVDIRQQGQNLVVEFLRSTLPEKLRRRLDVADFGTPVQAVSTFQSGDRVRMVVEPKGAWEHSAYQTDNQFVLEVRPLKADPNKLVQGPGYSGEKLSLNFQNIEVRALLQVIADFTNFNVVTSDTVTGTVTLRLKDVPWDQALDIILQSKGLGVRKSGNVLWVAPKEELANREQADLEARRKISDLEPTRTQAFQLNYTKAETIAKSLVGSALVAQAVDNATGQNSGRILSPRGSVIFEQRTNQLFVTDIPSKLEEVQAMIAKIDIPVRQVLIEARIVEARDNWGQSLGVKLGFANLSGAPTSGPGAQVGGNYAAVGAQTGQSPPVDFSNTQFVNLPANTGALGAAAATFALSLFSASADKFLNLELSALEQDGNGKIVSSPRVITADQVEAVIEQGEEIPYQQATSSGATSVTFRQATLRLRVVPQITPEGFVLLDLDVNKDAKGTPTLQGFTIDKKHVKTQVLVENGGTVVIGGIFTQENLEEINKVPLLGDIPYMGWLFKNRLLTTRKTELLVFITPKIVTDRVAAR
jgi:type IV pilus assembly protein PilQ